MNVYTLIVVATALVVTIAVGWWAIDRQHRGRAVWRVSEAERGRAIQWSLSQANPGQSGRCVCDMCVRDYWRPLWEGLPDHKRPSPSPLDRVISWFVIMWILYRPGRRDDR